MSRWRDRLVVALATVILGTTFVSAQPFSRPGGPGLTVVAGGGGGVTGLTSVTGTLNRLPYFDTATTLAASELERTDANTVKLLSTTAHFCWNTATGIRLDAAGSLSFSNCSTGHATGFGLGTATPKVITSSFTTPATALQVKDTSTNAFVVISGVTTAYLGLIDSDAAAGYKMVFLEHGADLIRLARFDDAATLAATYLSIVPSTNVVTLGSASVAGLVLSPGTGDVTIASGERIGYAVQSATCADNGNGGTPGTLTLQPTSNVITFTNSDAQGCTVTMSETAPLAGMPVTIIVISNAGGTVDFADSAGVLEIGTTVSLAVDDALTLMYANSAWYATAYKDN